MKLSVETVSYSNPKDRKILQACLTGWFKNPKDLNFTDPRLNYPFDFRRWCQLSYQKEGVSTFVLKSEGWIVAYMSVNMSLAADRAHIFHMFVDREARGKGYAKMLLDEGIDLAKEKGKTLLTLYVVPKNDRALDIYEKAGFTRDGLTECGNIKMKKWLTS